MAFNHADYSAYSELVVTREGRVATVTLNRPEALNAVSDEMHHELARVFNQLADDKEINVVVLTGSGKIYQLYRQRPACALLRAYAKVRK